MYLDCNLNYVHTVLVAAAHEDSVDIYEGLDVGCFSNVAGKKNNNF